MSRWPSQAFVVRLALAGEWGQIGMRERSQRRVAVDRCGPSAPLLRLVVVVVVAEELALMPAPARAQIRQGGDPQW